MSNFKKISKNIQQVVIDNPQKNNALSWININDAGKAEIEYLRKKYNFRLDHLRAATAKANSQRPVIDRQDGYVFLILHFPVMKENRIAAAEIEFFMGHGFLITLPSQPVEPLSELFALCKKDANSLLAYEQESSAILLYEILNKLLKYNYVFLDNNSITISQAEKTILHDNQKESAALVLGLRHNLINMRKIMQNHKNIIKRLMAMESNLIPHEQLKKYYGKLLDYTKNIWETLENQREMVEILFDSYESLANRQLSNTMKTLTIFYVTFSSLSLVAAIFSLKVDDGMPLLGQPNGFWLILGVMGAVGLLMLLLFKKKKWL